MDDLILYQALINEKANENSSDVLPNAGESHAAIVMAKMFEKTLKSVKMIVGSLDGKVSDQQNYLINMEDCINRDIPFEIIFLEDPNLSSKAYKILKTKQAEGKNIVFKSASDDVRNRLVKNGHPIHYAVFDDNKYRYEKNTKKYLALVCFNDKKNAAPLINIFNDSFQKSTVLI